MYLTLFYDMGCVYSGKTTVAELALLRMKKQTPKAKCVYIAPLKSLARERLKEWSKRLGAPPLNWKVLELSGDTSHDSYVLNKSDVLICTVSLFSNNVSVCLSKAYGFTPCRSPRNGI
jgi:RecG-like helicase